MLINGAGGQTAAELKTVLNISPNETLQTINSEVKALDLIDDKNTDEMVVRFANRILVSNAVNLTQNFQNTIRDDFESSVGSVDFMGNSINVTKEINAWISQQTNGKIPELFESLEPDTVLVIANALYFSGKWAHPFFEGFTTNGTFYGLNGTEMAVQMMRGEERLKYRSVERLNASLIELPFVEGSNTSMIIVLPNERNGLSQLIQELNPETLSTELNALSNGGYAQLNLTLPKFDLKTDYNLKTYLSELGLPTMFTKNADLSLITGDNNLLVSKAIHKAVLKVRESGVEAAAATGISISPEIWTPPQDVSVDRPFLFLLQDTRTGLLLFMGQVVEPKIN